MAKYAKLFANDADNVLTDYPQEIYARWRGGSYEPDTKEKYGVLCNAENFMDNFFKSALGSITPALISYNYRSKYFKTIGNVWVDTDFEKFHGTRINQTREWLNGRLHLLDLYFGINKDVPNYIEYYDKDAATWHNLLQGTSSVQDPTCTDIPYSKCKANDDIIILKDIFGANQSGI